VSSALFCRLARVDAGAGFSAEGAFGVRGRRLISALFCRLAWVAAGADSFRGCKLC
jgi:hypothetical protein